ncbi:restriction endonuclease subunit S [Fibrobacter sp. UWH6]|uniref:restriction endonuclease subunit S n=1 Tax=Fibrobacter sp. (strain UWH6) TaxID=1896212 RepID=UPI000918A88B|nr:restriction endonuclease subunit S [Fibrobacter sp. UWH6]SHL65575.1 Restriction endonuclease S subunit [Fibrobacter sp. UWH6]
MSENDLKRLGDYIRPVDVRNRDLKVTRLLGVSITKAFMPSIANIVGTDLSTYKVVTKGQFAYGPVTSRNGDKISVALLDEFDDAIISQAYSVFEVIDKNALEPEYLMMWFRRPEFDRYARFKSHGSAREVFDWDEMCEVLVPIPSIEKQREIVAEYNTLQNRIETNKKLIATLEQTACTIYQKMFQEDSSIVKGRIGDLCKSYSGYPFDGERYSETEGVVALRGENVTEQSLRWDTVKRFNDEITERIAKCYLQEWDVVIGMDGSKVGKNWSLVTEYDLPLLLAQRVTRLRANSIEIQLYIYMSLKMEKFSEYVSRVNTGSTILHISGPQIEDFPIVIPSDVQLKILKQEYVPLFESIKERRRENQLLTQMQTLLLSKIGG